MEINIKINMSQTTLKEDGDKGQHSELASPGAGWAAPQNGCGCGKPSRMLRSGAELPPLRSHAQGFAGNTLLNVTLLFSSVLSVFHLGWKGNSEADNYIADVGFLGEN